MVVVVVLFLPNCVPTIPFPTGWVVVTLLVVIVLPACTRTHTLLPRRPLPACPLPVPHCFCLPTTTAPYLPPATYILPAPAFSYLT